jgi:lipopolysaccharide transport system permease protein
LSRIIIEAKTRVWPNAKELWQYRDLFWVLAQRDLKVRYAQTVLGVAWAAIQPLATLIIFTIVFGIAVKVDTGDIPYPIYAMSGMVFWTYFSNVLTQSGSSIVGAAAIINKIYFPRLVVPLSKSIAPLIDMAITFVFLVVLMIWFQVMPSGRVFWLPLVILSTIATALGAGIWLSSLTIRFRDFQHIISFLVQLGLYATPVAYPASIIPEKYRLLYYLNPMAGVVQFGRYSLLGEEAELFMMLFSLGIGLLLFITSLFYFRSVEDLIADVM